MYSAYLKWMELIKGERKKNIYIKLLTYFLCDNIWSENVFSIIKLVFRGQREFCSFYYNVYFVIKVDNIIETTTQANQLIQFCNFQGSKKKLKSVRTSLSEYF